MMAVSFYTNQSDRKKIGKKIGNPLCTLNCIMKEDTSIIQPHFLVSKAALPKNYALINYAFVPELNRYFFVDKVTAVTGGCMDFEMTVDPLKTYKDGLMNTGFEVARSEALYDPLYVDPERYLQCRRLLYDLQVGVFPEDTGASAKRYTITVAGG